MDWYKAQGKARREVDTMPRTNHHAGPHVSVSAQIVGIGALRMLRSLKSTTDARERVLRSACASCENLTECLEKLHLRYAGLRRDTQNFEPSCFHSASTGNEATCSGTANFL